MNMEQSSLESNVVSYARSFPYTFQYGKNALLITEDNQSFIDFFAGAGALNFGHNHPFIKQRILDYLQTDSILHGLDMATTARKQYFDTLEEAILKPRALSYKVISCGPTGTNSVETALKLARKATGRQNVIAFSGGFHGMTLGALALTSDRLSRNGAGVSLGNVTRVPYVTEYATVEEALNALTALIEDDHSGLDFPAAIILETVQAEGGVNVAPAEWLVGIREICDRFGILLIVDDIQVGIGRTGTFFSFESSGIVPDIVSVSKSIGGIGMPLSLVLFKEGLDVFQPGEHTGTFRGNQLGFVASQAVIELIQTTDLLSQVQQKEAVIRQTLSDRLPLIDARLSFRGKGMIWGIDFSGIDRKLAKAVQKECVKAGLIIECAGTEDAVLKLLPPLTIEEELLEKGLNIILESIMRAFRTTVSSGSPAHQAQAGKVSKAL